jgi:hypothetical protein
MLEVNEPPEIKSDLFEQLHVGNHACIFGWCRPNVSYMNWNWSAVDETVLGHVATSVRDTGVAPRGTQLDCWWYVASACGRPEGWCGRVLLRGKCAGMCARACGWVLSVARGSACVWVGAIRCAWERVRVGGCYPLRVGARGEREAGGERQQ